MAAVLAIVLAMVFARGEWFTRAARIGVVSVVLVGAALLTPFYLSILAGETDDLANSTTYRLNFFGVFGDIEWVGLAETFVEYADGKWGWESGSYSGNVIVTLDNTLLLHALRFGWVSAALLAVILLTPVYWLIKSRGNAALVAVVSQLPTVLTVAMITQFAYVFWLFLGVAVTAHLQRPAARARWRH